VLKDKITEVIANNNGFEFGIKNNDSGSNYEVDIEEIRNFD
jgi:hypothetical protein